MTSTDQKDVDLDKLRQNINFTKLYKYFESKQSVFCDYFNVIVLQSVPEYIKMVNFITFNDVDNGIFSHWFEMGKDDSVRPNQINVLVNPPTVQPDVACLFTQPRPNISQFLLAFDLNNIVINESLSPHMLMQLSLNPSKYKCENYSCITFSSTSYTLNASEVLNLLLQMLVVAPINISSNVFDMIRKSVGNYALYRKIVVESDGAFLNLYNRDPVVKCNYSRSGIPL